MKVRQWAWLLLAGAVAPFVFDNGPDPVSDGLYRVVDDHGRIGYADAYGVVRIAPRFAFGLPFANGVAKVTLSGHPAAVPGSEGVSGFLCLGRLFQGQPNEAALCI